MQIQRRHDQLTLTYRSLEYEDEDPKLPLLELACGIDVSGIM